MQGVWMQITFNLDTEHFQQLKQRAEEESLAVSDLVNKIVREFLDKNRNSIN